MSFPITLSITIYQVFKYTLSVHTDTLLRTLSFASEISDLIIKHFFLLAIMYPSELIAYELIDWVDVKMKAQIIRE